MASTEDTIVYIGKNGLTDSVVSEMRDTLKARELVKGKVQESSLLTAREVCEELARLCSAEPVASIGSKFVLYKENRELDKDKRIKLAK